jgi:hypothetical protein
MSCIDWEISDERDCLPRIAEALLSFSQLTVQSVGSASGPQNRLQW